MPKQSRNPNDEIYSRSFACLTGTLLCRSELDCEIDRGDHAVGAGDSFAGDFECGAVIGTGARKRQTERYVHAVVECVQLQRDQTLVVIHAEYGIELTVDCAMENGIWRSRPRKDC